MAIFGPKLCVNPSRKKRQFLDFLNFMFFGLERRFFVLQSRKRHFPGLSCLKKIVGQMAILGPKPWVNPFRKMSIFYFLNFLFFWPRKAFYRSGIS